MNLCLYNDRLMPLEEGALPFTDLLIQRGIGCFEAFICPDKRPLAWDAHWARLGRSAQRLHIDCPFTERQMARWVQQGLDATDCPSPLVRYYLTAGDGPREGRYRDPRLFFLFLDHEDYPQSTYDQGMKLYTLKAERFWPLAKTTTYSVAFVAMLGRETDSEVLYTPAGEVTESHSSNFFGVLKDRLITAPLNRVLQGTTREIALTLAAELGLSVEERCLKTDELAQLDEAFVASTSKLFMPVTAIDDTPVGDGKRGPITSQLLDAYRGNLRRFTTDLKSRF